ncbi:hypothetical protein WJX74_008362 [Apatococcus lobatus]|uniref:Uncharacterized protein n=1 Tax=Apatococcus lobatus TaxID=904363 RepID=A0AAW1Q9F9_9CHLO
MEYSIFRPQACFHKPLLIIQRVDAPSCPSHTRFPRPVQRWPLPPRPRCPGHSRLSIACAAEPQIAAASPHLPDSSLINDDFAPVLEQARTFTAWDLAALWIGLVVSITTWYLAGGLVELGMAWWQGILTIVAGNLITLIPLTLTGHAGTKYGIPFPVLCRASFGIHGANLPSCLRALVATGWYGIQTWVGGSAIHQMLLVLSGAGSGTSRIAWLGISASELGCFLLFWSLQVGIILRGIESIKEVEQAAAPFLILLSAALLAWAWRTAGGLGPMLAAPSQFGPGQPQAGRFWHVFWPALTANVGYWTTLSLNIPDFTRYAKSQRAQVMGQALGLPLCMAAFTFVGLAVSSATISIFGRTITDPVQLLSCLGGPLPTCLGLLGLLVATLSTNIAANIVAPANALVNLAPGRISFKTGALLTSLAGILIMPWRLITSTQGFIFTWLIGYSALLGPIGGILLVDYHIVRQRSLDIDALFSKDPAKLYWFQGGWNVKALMAVAAGWIPVSPGFLQAIGVVKHIPSVFASVYTFAWFAGCLTAGAVYVLLMRSSTPGGAHLLQAFTQT